MAAARAAAVRPETWPKAVAWPRAAPRSRCSGGAAALDSGDMASPFVRKNRSDVSGLAGERAGRRRLPGFSLGGGGWVSRAAGGGEFGKWCGIRELGVKKKLAKHVTGVWSGFFGEEICGRCVE